MALSETETTPEISTPETPTLPEYFSSPEISPAIQEALNFLHEHGDTLTDSPHFAYLDPAVTVIQQCLSPDLTTNLKGSHPIEATAIHIAQASDEQALDLSSIATTLSIGGLDHRFGRWPLTTYWWETFLKQSEKSDPTSLTEHGGVYELSGRPDQASTTYGAAELQQSIAQAHLDLTHNTAHFADQPLQHNPSPPPFNAKQQGIIAQQAREDLQQAERGESPGQTQPHLSLITLPTSGRITNSRGKVKPDNQTNYALIQADHGKTIYRNPEHSVRIFRPGPTPDTAYYHDQDIDDFLSLNPEDLSQLLTPIDQQESNWHLLDTDHPLDPNTSNFPTFSVSSHIHEAQNQRLLRNTHSGQAVLHVNYDYDQLQFGFNHFSMDAAAAKNITLGMIAATRTEGSDNLPPLNTPNTEILLPYFDIPTPTLRQLKILNLHLTLSSLINRAPHQDRTNPLLIKLTDSLGLSKVTMHFSPVQLDKNSSFQHTIAQSNQFREDKLIQLDQFLQENNLPLSPKGKNALGNFIAPTMNAQHLTNIRAESRFGPEAVNLLPLLPSARLGHHLIPEDIDLNTSEGHESFWTELFLARLGFSPLEVLQTASGGWRKFTETLGNFTNYFLRMKMAIQAQSSDLGSNHGIVDNKPITIDRFITARPSALSEPFFAFAPSSFTQHTAHGSTIIPTSQDCLTPQYLATISIFDTPQLQQEIKETVQTLHPTNKDQSTVQALALDLLKQWDQLKQATKSSASTSDALILTQLLLQNQDSLLGKNRDQHSWQALQALLVSAMRQKHQYFFNNLV